MVKEVERTNEVGGKGLLREGVHNALTKEEAEQYASTLCDREIILLDALLSSLV